MPSTACHRCTIHCTGIERRNEMPSVKTIFVLYDPLLFHVSNSCGAYINIIRLQNFYCLSMPPLTAPRQNFATFALARRPSVNVHICSQRFFAPIKTSTIKKAKDFILQMEYVKRKGNTEADPIHIDIPVKGE